MLGQVWLFLALLVFLLFIADSAELLYKECSGKAIMDAEIEKAHRPQATKTGNKYLDKKINAKRVDVLMWGGVGAFKTFMYVFLVMPMNQIQGSFLKSGAPIAALTHTVGAATPTPVVATYGVFIPANTKVIGNLLADGIGGLALAQLVSLLWTPCFFCLCMMVFYYFVRQLELVAPSLPFANGDEIKDALYLKRLILALFCAANFIGIPIWVMYLKMYFTLDLPDLPSFFFGFSLNLSLDFKFPCVSCIFIAICLQIALCLRLFSMVWGCFKLSCMGPKCGIRFCGCRFDNPCEKLLDDFPYGRKMTCGKVSLSDDHIPCCYNHEGQKGYFQLILWTPMLLINMLCMLPLTCGQCSCCCGPTFHIDWENPKFPKEEEEEEEEEEEGEEDSSQDHVTEGMNMVRDTALELVQDPVKERMKDMVRDTALELVQPGADGQDKQVEVEDVVDIEQGRTPDTPNSRESVRTQLARAKAVKASGSALEAIRASKK